MELWESQHARNQAMLRMDDGDLPGARRELDALIARLSDANLPQLVGELAQSWTDRATVLRFANEWNEALQDLRSAEKVAAQLPVFPRRAVMTNVHLLRAKIQSTAFSPQFDLVAAQAALDELAGLWPGHWMIDELQSHLAFEKRDWESAASLAQRAATTLEQENWPRAVAACRLRAGKALLELNQVDDADHELTAAATFFAVHGPPDLFGETRLAQARVASTRENHDAAWTLALEALREVESRVRHFIDVTEQQRFVGDKLRYYDHAFDIGLAGGDDTGYLRAWSVVERSKSFYLAQLMANAEVPLFDGVDRALIDELERLEAEMDASERRLGMQATAADGGIAAAELEVKLEQLSKDRSAQLRTIMKANPRWLALRNPPVFDAATLEDALPADVVPLSYFWRHRPDSSELHLFTKDVSAAVVHEVVSWGSEELTALAETGARLRGTVGDFIEIFPDWMTERVLPRAVRDRLPKNGSLLVSPHGRLRGLPLHALPLDDSILIARWRFQYAPSLALLPHAVPRTPSDQVLLMGSIRNGFGDAPLSDVEGELATLGKVWSDAKRRVASAIVAESETPGDVGWPPSRWADFEILHFACHGAFPEGRPFDAALRLGEDAVRGSELFGITMKARVVSLSACALGQRAERSGNTEIVSEEWIGLYLPLFYAGARALVVSLWDAHSDTATQFMKALHTSLAHGAEPDAAFQTAGLTVSRKLAPRWANWCLVGLPPS